MKKIYHTTGNWKEFDDIDGKEHDECVSCHVIDPRKDIRRESGCNVNVCPKCGCDEFYSFKYETKDDE